MADTLLRIRLFVAVYEERSFTAAALRENATQSGATQHVRKLEEQYGVQLFTRSTSGVVPTPAGDAYYRSCLDVLHAHEHARHAIRQFSQGLGGEVVVGLTPTMTRGALAPTMSRFVEQHPNVKVKVIDAYSDIVIEKVRSGEVDFGVIPGLKQASGVHCELFGRSPEFLVSRPSGTVQPAALRPVALASLGPLKIVLPSHAQGRRALLESYFAATGTVIERRLEFDTSLGMLDFVAHTDWVALSPGISLLGEVDKGALAIQPLVEPPLIVELYLLQRARQPASPAARAFQEELRVQTARLEQRAFALMDG